MKQKRFFMSVIGVILCAISVAFFKHAAFGMDSFQIFVNGMLEVIPLSYGTLYVIINAVLLLFALVFDKHYIGLATLVNLFFLGYIVEFSLYLLELFLPTPGLVTRILCLAIGIPMKCLASSLYYTADMGVSTYDAIALIIANTWKLMKFRYCRISTEVCAVIIGAGLYYFGKESFAGIGVLIGIGSIISAFCMGPLIEVFTKAIAEPLLHKK